MQTSIATTTSFLRAIVQRLKHNSLSALKFLSFAFNARQQGISNDTSSTTQHFKEFKLKKEYEAQQLTEYKTNRIKMHAPYKI